MLKRLLAMSAVAALVIMGVATATSGQAAAPVATTTTTTTVVFSEHPRTLEGASLILEARKKRWYEAVEAFQREEFLKAVAANEARERAEREAAELAEKRAQERQQEAAVQQSPQTAPNPSGGPNLAALRECESGGNYGAVNPSGRYRGAYQFNQSTWDSVASSSHPHLVGVDPASASPADQDAMARSLYAQRGSQPWPHCGKRM